MRKPLFAGLVFDETGRPTDTAYVGSEPCYVIDDAGFRRHIPSEQVDRQVLERMKQQMEGHEEELAEQSAKMIGQEDLFSRAILLNQIKNMDQQFDALFETGIPEEARTYLGMIGMRIVIDQPGQIAPEGDE
jgi:hypothetical protein